MERPPTSHTIGECPATQQADLFKLHNRSDMGNTTGHRGARSCDGVPQDLNCSCVLCQRFSVSLYIMARPAPLPPSPLLFRPLFPLYTLSLRPTIPTAPTICLAEYPHHLSNNHRIL